MGVNRCVISLISRLKANGAVLSPGSRNAPMLHALAHSNLQVTSIVDERSAGFVALGMAKHLNAPVLLNCTSGTASLNYYPAIAEAFYARIPLIVITADRPPEQIDAWDGQAIRQKDSFKNHIRAAFETPSSYEKIEAFEEIALAVNTYWESEIPGPIHINIPIREPFYSGMNSEQLSLESIQINSPKSVSLRKLQEHLNINLQGKRIIIFNGMESGENVQVKIDCLAWQTVELSDITSNIPSELADWDAFLFNKISENFESCEILKPDVLITTGTTTVSKGLKLFLKKHAPSVHYHVSSYSEIGPMFGTKPIWVDSKNSKIHDADDQLIGMAQWSDFKSEWVAQTDSFNQKFNALNWQEFNEFSALKTVLENLPESAIVHLANSMTVRYASYVKRIVDKKNFTIRSNRGTSGIDGCTSTAVGEALCTEKPVYLITGDVAFLYDVNALWNNNLPTNFKIVVLNNQGGGIFELIQGPEKMGESARLQTTDHKRSIKKIAKAFDLHYVKAKSLSDVRSKLNLMEKMKDVAIMEIKTKRNVNQEFYAEFRKLN